MNADEELFFSLRNSLNREPREPREKPRPARGHAAFACLVYFAVYPVFCTGTGFKVPCPECEQKATKAPNCSSSFPWFASVSKKVLMGGKIGRAPIRKSLSGGLRQRRRFRAGLRV
jgi:hypothetical protein